MTMDTLTAKTSLEPAAKPAATPAPPLQPAAAGAAARLREDLIHPDPLLDCLIAICRLHGVGASRASLSAGLPLVAGRLTLDLAERAAARVGMSARLQRLAIDAIDSATLPALLILLDNRACVLQGWSADGRQAQVLMPETAQGSVSLTREELAARYTGVVLFVRPHFRFDSGRHLGVLFEVGLGVLPPLPEPLLLVRKERAALGNNV